jgi:hypothetical protein
MTRIIEPESELISDILTQVLPRIVKVNVSISSEKEDCEQATDYTFTLDVVNTVGARVRYNTKYRDFSIRWESAGGGRTEISKIKDGTPRWYIAAWKEGDVVVDWILVDCDILRKLERNGKLLLDDPDEKHPNPNDPTVGAYWHLNSIRQSIVARSMHFSDQGLITNAH